MLNVFRLIAAFWCDFLADGVNNPNCYTHIYMVGIVSISACRSRLLCSILCLALFFSRRMFFESITSLQSRMLLGFYESRCFYIFAYVFF